jgi:hypothetical protein
VRTCVSVCINVCSGSLVRTPYLARHTTKNNKVHVQHKVNNRSILVTYLCILTYIERMKKMREGSVRLYTHRTKSNKRAKKTKETASVV